MWLIEAVYGEGFLLFGALTLYSQGHAFEFRPRRPVLSAFFNVSEDHCLRHGVRALSNARG